MTKIKAPKLLIALSLFASSTLAIQAQQPTKINLPDEASTPVAQSHSQLVADQAKKTMELLALDSAMMKTILDFEKDEIHPCDELYGGVWSNQSAHNYSMLTVPDEYEIDLSNFVMPAENRVTSRFGWRKRRMHNGTDIKVQVGDPIRAAFDGEVRIRAFQKRGYGYYLVIRHKNGLESVYAHLSKFNCQEGDKVKAGNIIGLGGNTGRSTGSHLHLEFRFMGQAINPEDFIDFANFCVKDDTYTFRKGKSGVTKSTSKAKEETYASNSAVKYHKVKDGDTLGAIAIRHKTTVNRICKLNNIKPTTTLRIGRSIRVS